MDAHTAPVARRAFIAACKGQSWVDETFGIGTEEHGFYTGTIVLFDQDRSTWWALIDVAEAGDTDVLSSRQRKKLERRFGEILGDIDPAI